MSHRRLIRSTPRALAVALAAVLFAGSLISPAFGGPSLASLKRNVTRALKLARTSDARSRRALAATRQPGPTGPQGPAGPAGPPGTIGPGTGVPGSAAVTAVDFRENAGVTRVIYTRGGLVLTASCTAGPNLEVGAMTTVDHSVLHLALTRGQAAGTTATLYEQKNDFLTTGAAQTLTGVKDGALSATGGHLQGSLTFSTPTGTLTTLTYAAEQGVFGGAAAKDCWFGGMAVTNG